MKRAILALKRVANMVATLTFGAIVVTFGANIVARYVFSRPIIWADELVVVLLLWVTFLTAAFVTQEREQVVFDLVYQRFGPGGRRILLILGSALLALVFAAAFPAILSYTLFLWRERTNVLEWRLDAVYSCFFVFIAVTVVRRLWTVLRLVGPGWRNCIDEIEGREPGGGSAP